MKKVFRCDIPFALSINPLEGGIGLEALQLTEALTGEFDLHFSFSRTDEELGKSFLGFDANFLSLRDTFLHL